MNLLLSAVVLVIGVVVAIAGMLLVRTRAPDGSFFASPDRAAGVFGVLATSFSVLLAFVIFLGFTSYDGSKAGAEQEATNVTQQFETAQFMPASVTPVLEGDLICYGRFVVHQEWPEMQEGHAPVGLQPWTLVLFSTLKGVDPTTPVEQAAYSKWLDQTSDRETGRRDRTHSADGVIPLPLWLILFASSALVIGYMFFFADIGERRVVQALLMGTVTAMVITSLLVVNFLNNPYGTGPGGLKPVAMERSLGQMQQAVTTLGQHVVPPCDRAGNPVTP